MINFQNVSKQKKRNGGREGKDGGDWTSPPTGRNWKLSFTQRNFLPMSVSVQADQNLQSLSS